MRTLSVIADGLIAVMTEHPEPLREPFVDEPGNHVATLSYLRTMLLATAVNVVYGEKLVRTLTATGTTTAVVS